MRKMKTFFKLAMTISTGILIAMSLEGVLLHFLGNDIFYFQWYHPLSVIVCGIMCALPSMILSGEGRVTRKQAIARLVLHFLLLYALVMFIGKLFHWYGNTAGFMVLSLLFLLVYAFTWVVSLWLEKKEENEINEALKDIRDEE